MKKKSEEQRVASSSTRKRSSVVASLEKALAMGFRRELFIDDFLTERRHAGTRHEVFSWRILYSHLSVGSFRCLNSEAMKEDVPRLFCAGVARNQAAHSTLNDQVGNARPNGCLRLFSSIPRGRRSQTRCAEKMESRNDGTRNL